MANDDWLERLHGLAYRAQGLGVMTDLAGLCLCEMWGVYCYLQRVLES